MQRPSFLPLAASLALGVPLLAGAATPHQPQFRIDNFHAPLRIDNPLSAMKPGTRTVSFELEDGECKVNDVVVTNSAKRDFQGIYAGLAARAVSDRVWSDPTCKGKRTLLLENTTDYYGQDNGGNVWYFGEKTVEYTYDDAGHRTSSDTAGSWIAGNDGALAGIVMLARPMVGQFYRQEFLAGEAEDEALIVNVGIHVSTGLGDFSGCVRTRETTELSPGDVEYKTYCPNVGTVRVEAPTVHGGAELVVITSL